MTFANPDDDPRIWGEDPDWDERMRQYQAQLAEEHGRHEAARHRESLIRRTIDEVLEEAGEQTDTVTIRRRLRQAFGLAP